MRGTSWTRLVTCLALVGAWSIGGIAQAPPGHALEPVNPVVVDPADPANTGFLVFVEGDVTLSSDESEGTIALGGDLHLRSPYNVAAGAAPVRTTYVAPGDSRPTYLHVAGGIDWGAFTGAVYVENQGFTKVGDPSTYDAYDRDTNGALVNYRLVPEGAGYSSPVFVEGRSNAQTPQSVGEPVDLDFAGSFATYRDLTQQMAACADTLQLLDDSGQPLDRPIADGARGRLDLTPGRTNVLTLSASDLDALAEITFVDQPTAATPLLVNVTGPAFSGSVPNLAGVSALQAPYMLWNFPDATSVSIGAGDSIEGTLYAPNAALRWIPTQNIEGNVVAASFVHGDAPRGTPREIHDFPFATTLSCAAAPPPSAELTLVKQVVNDDDGAAAPDDFTLDADGPVDVEGETGTADVTDVVVPPGDYDLSESGPAGYETDGWTCDGGTLTDDTVTLVDGDDVTCTIVNDDVPVGPAPLPSPELTLVKEVVNDDGGTAEPGDFTLAADGPTPVAGVTGDAAVTDATVGAGEYDLSEVGPTDDYDPSAWTCTDGTLDGDVLTLADGDDATCTIVNDDVPPDGTGGFDDVTDDGAAGGDGSPVGFLPDTGAPAGLGLVAVAVACVATGTALLVRARRRA
ncbi:collagen-binding domain-containing protein [Aeromicrobium sp. IC_218]|uniref:collagen-binding domain-containing protein n=1 Tax=Aeromicrobium sp. IC_218 TaxID=2545468 RepID=UPI0010407EC9|nr:collagen-binding domain-containing protein [Aeromicrobium sp. IC_218]TCI96009.1 choice-of-anchor A family protein [Aeromicrobium sp. IC_218]